MFGNRKVPIVPIIYSHDSPAHDSWVAQLARDLRRNGVDVRLDAWDLDAGADVGFFMERNLRVATRVLVICSEGYVRKANGRWGGAGFESSVVGAALARCARTRTFIPVIRQPVGPRGRRVALPTVLASRFWLDFSDDRLYAENLDRLLRDLHGVRRLEKPPLGENPFAVFDAAAGAGSARGELAAEPVEEKFSTSALATTLRLGPAHQTAAEGVIHVPHMTPDARTFLEESFELTAHRFGSWLTELEKSNAQIKTCLCRIDERQFSVVLYSRGRAIQRCRVRLNLGRPEVGVGIVYSRDDSEDVSTFHESLLVESDGESMFLRPLGALAQLAARRRLTPEQGARLYWSFLVAPLRN